MTNYVFMTFEMNLEFKEKTLIYAGAINDTLKDKCEITNQNEQIAFKKRDACQANA